LRIRIKIAFFLLLAVCAASGQDISFSNISTTNGLSDNFIRSIAVDKKGFLWIGTNEGLNSYDGYSVTNYSLKDYPEIPHKTVYHLFCEP
jgi:ligand-binding sensor domain-containing protein